MAWPLMSGLLKYRVAEVMPFAAREGLTISSIKYYDLPSARPREAEWAPEVFSVPSI